MAARGRRPMGTAIACWFGAASVTGAVTGGSAATTGGACVGIFTADVAGAVDPTARQRQSGWRVHRIDAAAQGAAAASRSRVGDPGTTAPASGQPAAGSTPASAEHWCSSGRRGAPVRRVGTAARPPWCCPGHYFSPFRAACRPLVSATMPVPQFAPAWPACRASRSEIRVDPRPQADAAHSAGARAAYWPWPIRGRAPCPPAPVGGDGVALICQRGAGGVVELGGKGRRRSNGTNGQLPPCTAHYPDPTVHRGSLSAPRHYYSVVLTELYHQLP